MKKTSHFFTIPWQVLLDISILFIVFFFICDADFTNSIFLTYISLFWLISSLITKFYKVYRYTNFLRLLYLMLKQFFIFILGFFAFFGIFKEGVVINNQFIIILLIITSISFFKLLFYFSFRRYRALGKNNKNTVVLGFDSSSAKKIINLFNNKPELGYNFVGFFSDTKHNENSKYLGDINGVYNYSELNNIDGIYACVSELKKEQIKEVTIFSDKKNIQLKLVPNTNELFSKNRQAEFYDDSLKVFSIGKLPFEVIENRIVKRIFDVIFSSLVIIFLMSWLTPILWVLIKLESKGPLLFKQDREGLNGDKFLCYKFRSMMKNNLNVHATKNDVRVTKIGSFIRKTSIDELPQFFNVFLGDMSIVGPRPHMRALALEYQKDVDNYISRHAVKPGITGLAQVSGCRGEVKKPADIINRVRFDIFYIENWSFLFDIKIIIKTVLNVFRGDDKAY